MRDSLSGHKTGLPKKLLDLFNPLPPVETVPPVHRRKPKLPYSGVGQYVDLFAAPGATYATSAVVLRRHRYNTDGFTPARERRSAQ